MRKAAGFTIILITIVVCLMSLGAVAGSPTPQYWPSCPSPQNIAPMQAVGGQYLSARSAMVWNGSDFALVWVESSYLLFQRVFADGTPAGYPASFSLMQASATCAPSLVWTGTQYGVAYTVVSPSTLHRQVYFSRLTPDGGRIGSEVKVSFATGIETCDSFSPVIAYGRGEFAVAWTDARNGPQGVYATLLSSSGGVFTHDIELYADTGTTSSFPSIVWSKGAGKFVVAWESLWGTSPSDLFTITLAVSGQKGYAVNIWQQSGQNHKPMLADSGNGLGMLWEDYGYSPQMLLFVRLRADGSSPLPSYVTLSGPDPDGPSLNPYLVWTGAEYGAFWDYTPQFMESELWFQRVNSSGTLQGTPVQVTYTSGTNYPSAAFARYGYLVAGVAGSGGPAGRAATRIVGSPNFVLPLGCYQDYTPPSCPESLGVYSVTGTSATVSWLPSVEELTDVAYYQVFRDNEEIGTTSATYFSDSGLSPGGTYKYDIRAVNAAQMSTFGCPDSTIYLKTNASLILRVDKSSPDARLTWSGEAMNSYNVFRGTNPQVMKKIGQTSGQAFSDSNVLLDGVVYYYTVDEPGW
jgi:hypothetical protein